ncbi:MAG: hypothetical protein AAFP83_17065, partial [Bacteroidota bacterium]
LFYVRALAQKAILPDGIGQVDLPEWLEEQEGYAKQLKEEKLTELKKKQLEKKLIFPGMLSKYIEDGVQSSLFEYHDSEDAFELSLEEKAAQNEKLMQENEEKDAELTALKARLKELEKSESD